MASSQPVDLILSERSLSYGTVGQLVNVLFDLPITAYVCFPVDRSCLWTAGEIAGDRQLSGLRNLPKLFNNWHSINQLTHRFVSRSTEFVGRSER